MSNRRVNINTPLNPDPRVMEWFEANGIDPRTVPAAQEVLVEDGKLAFVQFDTDDEGKKILGGDGCLKTLRIVDLVSAPENHGL